MYDHARTYRTARAYFSALEAVFYVGIAVDALFFLIGLSRLGGGGYSAMMGLYSIVTSLVGAVGLLVLIVNVQVGRAVVDTAETNREMVQLMRQATDHASGTTAARAEPGKPAGVAPYRTDTDDRTAPTRQSQATPAAKAAPREPDAGIILETYRGHDIVRDGASFYVPRLGGTAYDTPGQARQAIDMTL